MKYIRFSALILTAALSFIAASCMEKPDFVDTTVKFIPKDTEMSSVTDGSSDKKDIPDGAIDDIAQFSLFGIENYEQRWLYRTAKAIVTNDVPLLEECLRVETGTMASWDKMIISDYLIIPDGTEYLDMLTLEINIQESNVERFSTGKYRLTIYEGSGNAFKAEHLDAPTQMRELTDAEKWVLSWAENYGGWLALDEQTVENKEYAHYMTDLYLSTAYTEGETATYEGFIRFCEDRFGYTAGFDTVTRESVEAHGAHCAITSACEVTTVGSEDGKQKIRINFFADQLYSVVSRTYLVTVITRDGYFVIENVECTYDSGAATAVWSL